VFRDFKCIKYFREHLRQKCVTYIKAIGFLENEIEAWNPGGINTSQMLTM
jgi:hypothetical protein